MVLGYNHNITYKGEVFHVQTEDSGMANPHIITVLYRGGVIISSKKTCYADILKMDSLKDVVEELMQEQHKGMMRRLKAGEFDKKAFDFKATLIENYEIPPPAPEEDPLAQLFSSAISSGSAPKAGVSLLSALPRQSAETESALHVKKTAQPDASTKAENLDEAILSFFGPRDK